jgi:pimeloyl-ACP methyl ester carboxylesterase
LNDRRFFCNIFPHPKMKKLFSLCLTLACLTTFAGSDTNTPPAWPMSAANPKNIYVIVHGAWGGGWDWKHVGQLLTADGNEVYRPTLTGLGEHSNFTSTNIDLDTHIQDIVNVILWEDLHDVVLVGHSYGGMVITGVADRIPDRIKHVIYVDALLPENGECSDTSRPGRTNVFTIPVTDGFIIPPWVQANTPPPHDTPMPARTFSQPITLTNQAVAQKLPTTYILTVDAGKKPEQDDFYVSYQRAKARGWPALTMESNHTVERSHPNEVVRLIEQAVQ